VALRSRIHIAVVAGSSLAAVTLRMAVAQHITVDGRFSPAQTLVGPNYAIGANLGRQLGGNLFHSFGQFGLVKGESASFTGPPTVANVIGRVTGGSPSSIDGKIQSNIAGANLYLINPSGIVFGPNATVNVSGSFRASTADYIKMSDGARFQAINPDGSTLSAAPPAAFGFLNPRPAKIAVNGSTLGVPSGQTLGLVGGPISITAASPTSATGATLSAPAGTIRVTSVAGSGEIPAAKATGTKPTVTGYGPIEITNGSRLDVSDALNVGSAGNLYIRSGTLAINSGSQVNDDHLGSGVGGRLVLRSDGNITISDGATVHAVALGSGKGSNITVKAGQLSIQGGLVTSGSNGLGASGDMSVSVAGPLAIDGNHSNGNLSPANTAGISSSASAILNPDTKVTTAIPASSGTPGNIAINAGSLSIVNAGAISATTFGSGKGGDVMVNVSALDLENFGEISSFTAGIGKAGDVAVDTKTAYFVNFGELNTNTVGPGNGGNVRISVLGNLTILGAATNNLFGSKNFYTGIGSATAIGSTGTAGDVTVSAGSLSIGGFLGQISSGTFGPGAAGSVFVDVAGPLSIAGPRASFPTGIFAAAFAEGTGNAGDVAVKAGSLSVVNGGEISSTTAGFGNGGSVRLTTPGALVLEGLGTGITASAAGPQSGRGGSVMVDAGKLTIKGGAQIASTTVGAGAGGPVQVTVRGPLSLSDPDSGINASATASGNAGSVMVGAPQITIASGATIASTTAGTGVGGSVAVTTPGALLLDGMGTSGTQISASAIGPQSGPGGSVTVSAGSLTIRGGAQIASTTAGLGNGGDLAVSAANDVTLSGSAPGGPSGITASARQGSSGRAGDVVLTAGGAIALSGGARVTSSTAGVGNGGRVQVVAQAPLILSDPGTGITASASSVATGNAGSVAVIGPQIRIVRGAEIASTTAGSGAGGMVSVITPGALVLDGESVAGTQIAASATGPQSGPGGSVSVLANSVTIQDGAQIASTTAGPGTGGDIEVTVASGATLSGTGPSSSSGITASALGTGNAGNIDLTSGSLSLSRGGVVATDTLASGNGGSVTLEVAGPMVIDGSGEPGLTGISSRSRAGTGNGGSVRVNANTLSVLNEGMIGSGTLGPGNGGSIFVDTAGQLLITNGGQISATSGGGLGSGGDVVISSAELSMLNGGTISSGTLGPGSGGNVLVTVPGEILVDGNHGGTPTGILATATPASAGTGGNVTLNSAALTLRDGGVISTERFGSGHTGSISLDVAQRLSIDGSSGIGTTGISAKSEPASTGNAGDITVQAGALSIGGVGQISASTQGSGTGGNIAVMVEGTASLNDRGQITAESTGSGDAGLISVSAGRLLLSNRATISTRAEKATASGGNITLKVRDLLYLVRSDITTSVQGETGNGGNVEIDPQLVILNHSSIKAQAKEGHGGKIEISAGAFIPSADSTVDASSELGISGTVEITGPRVDVNGALVVLSSELRSAVEVLRHTCAAQATQPQSSLVEAGRGGLPQDPEATLPALYIARRDVNLTSPKGADTAEPIRAARTTAQLIIRCS
jgi:filamentous hemagglutinin family protein